LLARNKPCIYFSFWLSSIEIFGKHADKPVLVRQ
jgi:hypothetical protein